MKEHFIRALEHLKQMIADISAHVEQSVFQAVSAVRNHDTEIARTVIGGDDIVDDAEIRIEEECLKILALYQPVAGDLRQVVTILKINNEIERVGDLAVNIAERVLDMSSYDVGDLEKIDFGIMVEKTCGMLRKSLDSMIYHDAVMAAEVIRLDDEVDALHRDNYGKVKEMMLKYPQAAGYYLNGLTVSRCLERIADTATNICENVIYLEHGRIVRHHHEGAR